MSKDNIYIDSPITKEIVINSPITKKIYIDSPITKDIFINSPIGVESIETNYSNGVVTNSIFGEIAVFDFDVIANFSGDVIFTVDWGVQIGETIINTTLVSGVSKSLQTSILIPEGVDPSQTINVTDSLGGSYAVPYTVTQLAFSFFINTALDAGDNFQLPLPIGFNYNFEIDWDDGNFDTITAYNQLETNHIYSVGGTYNPKITGTCEAWRFDNAGSKLKFTGVQSWGDVGFISMAGGFYGCTNLTVLNDLTGEWAGTVIDMSEMFRATLFNQDIDSWNVANVTNMNTMFFQNTAFNQSLNSWDVSNIETAAIMFSGATAFNGNISSWVLSSATALNGMFSGASSFDSDISGWNVSANLNFSSMFFNTPFNQDIGSWVVSSGTNFSSMFDGNSSFDQDIGSWNMSNATTLLQMFRNASLFNQDISSWDVSKVTNMRRLFNGAFAFNGDITGWNVSLVANMSNMFLSASSFDQDLGGWNVIALTNAANMFNNITLAISNYDSLLIGWEALILQNNVTFSGGGSQYSAGAAATAKASIESTYSWIITDGGEV